MDNCECTCIECKNDVPVEEEQQICCISCYERLKKDVRELLRLKAMLEGELDAKSN